MLAAASARNVRNGGEIINGNPPVFARSGENQPMALPPLDPRLLVVVIAARRALLILADALGEIAGLDSRAGT